MTTQQVERLLSALERIADALDPPPEKAEDRQFASSAQKLRLDRARRQWSIAEAERRMRP